MSGVSAKIRQRDKFLNLLYRSFKISLYVLAILIVLLLSQMIIGFQYYTILLIGILSFSFGMGAIVSCFLSYKIFSWYRSNASDKKRNKLGILLIALTITTLCLGMGLTLSVNANVLLLQSPAT